MTGIRKILGLSLAICAMKTKAIPSTIAAIIVGLASVQAQPKNTPVKFANDVFVPATGYIESLAVAGQQFGSALLTLGAAVQTDKRFANDLDSNVRRTTNSAAAGHIKSLVKPGSSGSADYLASINRTNRPLQACRFTYHNVTSNSPLLGKRIRASGWLKTKDVEVMAGATLVILNTDGHIFASDPMTDRPILGTGDWMEIEIVTDVPSEPCTIYFGPSLYGPGELWADDFQISIAPTNKPITDDRIWHVWSPNPNDYSMTTDLENTHNGKPTLCFAYIPKGEAPTGSWMWWGQDIRNPDKYRGHTVRMTVWIKSENVSNRVRPNLRPKGSFFKLLAQDKRVGGKNIRGTMDWAKHTILCEIPEDTQCLDTGFAFHGSGRFWVDMESLKYEIADGETQ
jgi:hypothetical protein